MLKDHPYEEGEGGRIRGEAGREGRGRGGGKEEGEGGTREDEEKEEKTKIYGWCQLGIGNIKGNTL